MPFDFYRCEDEECGITFAIESEQFDEPTCQCGCTNNIFIGTKTIQIEVIQNVETNRSEIQGSTVITLPTAG